MEPYVSEDEQVEEIKKWLKDNGSAIITGIAIGIAAILGWQYWNNYRLSTAEQASLHFDTLSQAVANDDAAAALRQGQTLLDDYDSSTYAALSALMLAKLALKEGDRAAAGERLQWILDNTDAQEIKTIARLRLARVMIAENQPEDALAQLEQINNPNFTAEIEELRGDIFLARNEPDQARSAYEAARAALGNSGLGSLLDMKLENLPPRAQE